MRPSRLMTYLAAVTAVAVYSLPAFAQETLKMNISIAQNSHYGAAVDTFARELEKRSNGRFKVQNFTLAPLALNASRSRQCNWARLT